MLIVKKEAKLIFDKFINGENISDEDSVQNINQVIDIMSKRHNRR